MFINLTEFIRHKGIGFIGRRLSGYISGFCCRNVCRNLSVCFSGHLSGSFCRNFCWRLGGSFSRYFSGRLGGSFSGSFSGRLRGSFSRYFSGSFSGRLGGSFSRYFSGHLGGSFSRYFSGHLGGSFGRSFSLRFCGFFRNGCDCDKRHGGDDGILICIALLGRKQGDQVATNITVTCIVPDDMVPGRILFICFAKDPYMSPCICNLTNLSTACSSTDVHFADICHSPQLDFKPFRIFRVLINLTEFIRRRDS